MKGLKRYQFWILRIIMMVLFAFHDMISWVIKTIGNTIDNTVPEIGYIDVLNTMVERKLIMAYGMIKQLFKSRYNNAMNKVVKKLEKLRSEIDMFMAKIPNKKWFRPIGKHIAQWRTLETTEWYRIDMYRAKSDHCHREI